MKRIFGLIGCVTAVSVLCAETVSMSSAPSKTVYLKDGTEVTLQAKYDVDVKVERPAEQRPRVAALMVKNATGKAEFDRAAKRLGSQIAAQIVGADVEIIDVEDTVFSIDARREVDGSGRPVATQEERIKGDSSRIRLAENAGADYLLTVTLEKFTKNTRRLRDRRFGAAADGSGAQIVNEIYKVTGSYRVADVYSGSAFDGGVLQAQTTLRKTAATELELGEFADGLEEELAAEMAAVIREKAPTWREASLEKSGIPVSFTVLAYDLNNKPIYLPMLKEDSSIVNERVAAEVAATVEIDGVARGTTGCTVRLARGMHQVRFSRVGYDDLTMTVVPSEGLSLTVNLRMTEQEYARVKDSIAFMHRLTMEREINQAEVVEREGHAKMLEQSGIQVKADKLPDVIGVPGVVPVVPVMQNWISR